MRYDSAYSKPVKRGLVMSCLTQSIKKYCLYKPTQSLSAQVERLISSLIVAIARRLLSTINGRRNTEDNDSNKL